MSSGTHNQTLTIDTTNDTIWWVDKTNKLLVNINFDGTTALTSIATNEPDLTPYAPDGVSYDASTLSLWVVDNGNDAIRRVLISDGLPKQAVVPDYTTPDIDGVFYTGVTGEELLISDDTDDRIYWVNIDNTTGRSFLNGAEGEGLSIVDGVVYWNADPGTDGNRLHANISDLIATSDFTMSAWCDTASNSSADQLFGFGNAASGTGIGLYATTTTNYRMIINETGETALTSNHTVAAATNWKHCSVVVDRTNSEMRFILNGVQDGAALDISSYDDVRVSNFVGLIVGAQTEGGAARHTASKIDDMRVYRMAATASQALMIYKNSGGT